MAFTLDPTLPANSENIGGGLGASRIRNLAGWVLQLFGQAAGVAFTWNTAPFTADANANVTANGTLTVPAPTAVGHATTRAYVDAAGPFQGTSTSAANTYTVTLATMLGSAVAPATQAALLNLAVLVKFQNGNTGAATLNANSFGAQAIQKNGAALTGGEIVANEWVWLTWDGTNWQMVMPPSTVTLAPAATRNLAGSAAGGTTTMALTADVIVMRNPSTNYTLLQAAFSATENISVAGPTLNGRDQAGAFTVSSFVHIYAIGGIGQTAGLIASATGPATGPTLPTNYTSWAYLATVLLDGSGNITACFLRGSWIYYTTQNFVSQTSGPTTGTPNTQSVSATIPAIAAAWRGACAIVLTTTTSEADLQVGALTGTAYQQIRATGANNITNQLSNQILFELPQVSQQFFWTVNNQTAGTQSYAFYTLAYSVPNNA